MSTADSGDRIGTLSAALSDEKVSVGWNAAKELAKIGPAASTALPALAEALRSTDATTALWARYAVAKITGDVNKHLPALIAALDDRRVYPGMAASALAGFAAEAKGAIPRLMELLRPENHPDNRWAAAFALGQMGPGAREAVPALADALADSDEKLRWYAAFALGEIDADSASAVPSLIRALDDFDEDVRGYAARALGRIGGREAVPQLQILLTDDNESVRNEAAAALARIQGAGEPGWTEETGWESG